MTFKELVSMLSHFAAIPNFCKNTQVFRLFRQFTRRTLIEPTMDNDEAVLGDDGKVGMTKHLFRMKKDGKGRNWRSVQLDGIAKVHTENADEVFRPDFLNFSQFCELLGHLAISAFNHEKAEERVKTLFKWLDQSGGTNDSTSTAQRSHAPIRWAVRTDY